jgi:hypothetical protein
MILPGVINDILLTLYLVEGMERVVVVARHDQR